MVNIKIGAILLIAGSVLFLLSDTFFGDSEAASYSLFLGLIMVPIGLFFTLVGVVQVVIAKIKGRRD